MATAKATSPLSVFRQKEMRPALYLLAALALVAAIAWLITLLSANGMNSAMMAMMVVSGPDGVAFFLLSWAVMMVAMMFPSAAPMVQAYVNLCVEKEVGSKWRSAQAAVFLGAYVTVWTLFGAGVAALYLLLSSRVEEIGMTGTLGSTVAGVFLIAAGVYQATPLKRVCLNACRGPMEFLMTRFRSGVKGGLRMGVEHAAYCVGCCWMMFIVLFAVGVMSLPWMALLAVVIFVEKLTPPSSKVSWAFGVLFVMLGAILVLLPDVGMFALGIPPAGTMP
jgi:predicted metal-binding membrane protein